MQRNEQAYRLIDVRTTAEFVQGTIPGAINLPLFDEDERRRIGRAYTKNHRAAKFLALDLVAPRLPRYLRRLSRQGQDKPLLVFCWRGGMRSHAVVEFLAMLGVEAAQLRGGYKQYRRLVYRKLQEYELKPKLILLKGKTGVGKTEILEALGEKGYPVIDLEGLAGHRGSIFGDWRQISPQSQKNFDSLLLQRLHQLRQSPYLLLEGESRRIGNICLPAFLFSAMQSAAIIEVGASFYSRISRILRDYGPKTPEAQQSVCNALCRLEGVLSAGLYAKLKTLLSQGEYHRFVEAILISHYDRLYAHGFKKAQILGVVDSDNPQGAISQLESILSEGGF